MLAEEQEREWEAQRDAEHKRRAPAPHTTEKEGATNA